MPAGPVGLIRVVAPRPVIEVVKAIVGNVGLVEVVLIDDGVAGIDISVVHPVVGPVVPISVIPVSVIPVAGSVVPVTGPVGPVGPIAGIGPLRASATGPWSIRQVVASDPRPIASVGPLRAAAPGTWSVGEIRSIGDAATGARPIH